MSSSLPVIACAWTTVLVASACTDTTPSRTPQLGEGGNNGTGGLIVSSGGNGGAGYALGGAAAEAVTKPVTYGGSVTSAVPGRLGNESLLAGVSVCVFDASDVRLAAIPCVTT